MLFTQKGLPVIPNAGLFVKAQIPKAEEIAREISEKLKPDSKFTMLDKSFV